MLKPTIVSHEEFLSQRKQLQLSGKTEGPVGTTSMVPLIQPGEYIRIEPLSDPLVPFDVIVFWASQKLVCHFIWSINTLTGIDDKRTYNTRGLQTDSFDLPVPEENILGIVVSHKIPMGLRFRVLALDWWKKKTGRGDRI